MSTASSKNVVMFLGNDFAHDVRVYKEAVYLISRGFTVFILCWDREKNSTMPIEDNVDGINVVRFRCPSEIATGKKQLPAFFSYIKQCRKWLKGKSVAYFHANDIDGAMTWYFAKRSKAPLVFDMHEYYEDYGNHTWLTMHAYRWLTLFFIKKSKYSLYENNLYLRGAYIKVRSKLLSLRNLPDSDLIKALPKTPSEIFRIGYHGAVRGQIQEFTTLFEAVKDMPDVRVDIHGGGPDLKKLLELQKSYKNVTVHGPFDGTKELTGLYANSDIVFAGYHKDSKSCECDEMVKFFECIFTGTPMILTEVYALMAKQIREGGFGIACDTDNVEEVRAAVLQFKDNRDFLKQCSENELAHAKEFDWKEAVKILDKVYE